jgi:hypothetical protein
MYAMSALTSISSGLIGGVKMSSLPEVYAIRRAIDTVDYGERN